MNNWIGFNRNAVVDLRATLITAVAAGLIILAIKIVNSIRYRLRFWRVFERGNVPVVPGGSFFSGNLFNLIGRRKNLKLLDQWHRKLGKTYGAFYGIHPWAFTIDADLIQRLFLTDALITTVSLHLPFLREVTTSIAQINGNHWRKLRRAVNPSFTNKQMKSDNVYRDLQASSDNFLNCLANYPVEERTEIGKSNVRIVDVLYNARKFTVDSIFRVAYARDESVNWSAKSNDPLLDRLVASSTSLGGPFVYPSVIINGISRLLYFLIQHFTALGKDMKIFNKEIEESVASRRKMSPKEIEENRKLVDTFMEGVKKSKLDDVVLHSSLFFLFVAGFDTTANSIAILCWLLAKHPEVQTKLRLSVLAEGENSKYLDCCIKEGMRLYPPVPTGVGREIGEDMEFKNMKFFKGTSIVINIHILHHSKEYWGDDVELFKPERFSRPLKHPAQFMPFALGARNCLGERFAMLEIKTLMSRLIVKYRLETCSTTPDKIKFTSPNMVNINIEGCIDLKLVEIGNAD